MPKVARCAYEMRRRFINRLIKQGYSYTTDFHNMEVWQNGVNRYDVDDVGVFIYKDNKRTSGYEWDRTEQLKIP